MITLISLSFVSEQTAYLTWLGKKVRPWERMFMIVITSFLLLFPSKVQELPLCLGTATGLPRSGRDDAVVKGQLNKELSPGSVESKASLSRQTGLD